MPLADRTLLPLPSLHNHHGCLRQHDDRGPSTLAVQVARGAPASGAPPLNGSQTLTGRKVSFDVESTTTVSTADLRLLFGVVGVATAAAPACPRRALHAGGRAEG